jgi:general stress protein 26
MAKSSTDKEIGLPRAAEKKLDELYELIDGIETAMFTTRRTDGALVSRAMQVQKRQAVADLWFVTDIASHKLDELENDPHVNCAFFRDRTREWVSVSGIARVMQDRAMIRELYDKSWKAWFGDEGGKYNGEPDDPRFALVLVEATSVSYLKIDKPRPVVLFEVVKAMVTGEPPRVGEQRTLDA